MKQWSHSQDIIYIFIGYYSDFHFFPTLGLCSKCSLYVQYTWPYSRFLRSLCLSQVSPYLLWTERSVPAALVTNGASDREKTLSFPSLLALQCPEVFFSQLELETLNWKDLPQNLHLRKTGGYTTGPSLLANIDAGPWRPNTWHVAFTPNSCFSKLQCMCSNHKFWGQQCLVFLGVCCVLFSIWNTVLDIRAKILHLESITWELLKLNALFFFARGMCNFQQILKEVCICFTDLMLLQQITTHLVD